MISAIEIANEIIKKGANPKYPIQWKDAIPLANAVVNLTKENARLIATLKSLKEAFGSDNEIIQNEIF